MHCDDASQIVFYVLGISYRYLFRKENYELFTLIINEVTLYNEPYN